MAPFQEFQFPEPYNTTEAIVTTLKNIISTINSQKNVSTAETTQNMEVSNSQQIDVNQITSTKLPSTLTDQFTQQAADTVKQNILTTLADNITSTVDNITSTVGRIFTTVSSIADTSTLPTTTENRIIFTGNLNTNSSAILSNNNSTTLFETTDGNSTITEVSSTVATILENATSQVSTDTSIIREAITSTTESAITATSTVFENITAQPTAVSETIKDIIISTTETITDTTNAVTDAVTDINVTDQPSTVTETIKDVITATTEKVVSVTNNITRSIVPNTTDPTDPQHLDHDDNSLVVYIIIGVLLAILLILFIALFVFYKRKKSFQVSNGYYVTQLKDVSSSSSKNSCNVDDTTVKGVKGVKTARL